MVPVRGPVPAPPTRRARLRRELLTVVAVFAVGALAACFAHGFVLAGEATLEALFGAGRPADAALRTHPLVVAGVAAVAVCVAAGIARLSRRAGSGRTGLRHVKLALDGDPADAGSIRPSLRATLVRAMGTFASSVGLVSIGRETAMIESGGALGATLGQRLRLGPTLAIAGVAAAFTGAYTAPLGALAYVDDHLGIRRSRRAMAHAVLGAAAGYATGALLWERHSVLPHPDRLGPALLLTALVVAVPATVAARGLFGLRRRAEQMMPRFGGLPWIVCAVVAAGTVGVARSAAGNGMNSLALAAAEPVLWAAVGLAVFRVIGMLAALAAGVPGGVILPTMAVAAGWGLLTVLAVERFGVDLPGSRWDAMLLAATIGVAVGLRAPLLAVVMVPEMAGDYRLLPLTAAVVLLALPLDRLILDRLITLCRRRAASDADDRVEPDREAGMLPDAPAGEQHAGHEARPVVAVLAQRQRLSRRAEQDLLVGVHPHHPDTVHADT